MKPRPAPKRPKRTYRRKKKWAPPPESEPSPTGRPTDYSAELAESLCQRIAGGESLRAICRDDETLPERGTIMRWLFDGKHESFSAQYALATKARAELWAEETVEISDTEPDTIKARLMVDTRKWAASKLLPKYRDTLELVPPAPPPAEIQSEDEAMKIVGGLVDALAGQQKIIRGRRP